MKKYNIQNYIRYKEDLKQSNMRIEGKFFDEYTRDELIVKFMPLVENIARKFATSQQASGVLDITDLIQEGNKGLVQAVDKINYDTLCQSDNLEQTLKSFLSKRIKGAIRRSIDINRGDMRIPEYKLNEIRKDFDKDKKIVQTFFNQIFTSLDKNFNSDFEDQAHQIPDNSEPYNIALLNSYLLGLMRRYLNDKEYDVLRQSFGLDCDKCSAKEIAENLGIEGVSNYVRVSEIKKSAIHKLVDNVEYHQVIDFL